MLLHEAIAAAGMTPPEHFPLGKFVRFPGYGKKRGNTAGWCKRLTETLAVYGDWSANLSAVWTSDTQLDEHEKRRLLASIKSAERERRIEDLRKARAAEQRAQEWLDEAKEDTHPYLISKGFKHSLGLVREGELLIGMHAVEDYRLINLQRIGADGTKRFLTGGRARGAIHILGPREPDRRVLCEGFVTGLTLRKAFKNLPGHTAVIVCFSAGNLVTVAPEFPRAIVCADHDESRTGEQAARQTGLRWIMPEQCGEDFNDLSQRAGIIRVTEQLRGVLS